MSANEPRGAAEMISASEAAERFAIEPSTIARWEREEGLRPLRVAGRTLYSSADIARLAAHEAAGDPIGEQPPAARPTPSLSQGERLGRARRRALEVLHSSDVSGADPRDQLTDVTEYYTRALVDGVVQHRDELDTLLRERAEHWTLERMPVTDRNILRIGIYELLYTDVPTGVVIDQAVSLARLLSTEESGRFVNGILGRVARDRRS